MLQLETEPDVQASAPQPSPSAIFEMLTRYQQSMALKGAIELNIFTHVASGANTSFGLAARCRSSERGVRILCDYLTVMGLLKKSGRTYSLSEDAALFLNKRSPAYIGSIAEFVGSDTVMENFRDLASVVRGGGALNGVGTMGADDPIWVNFARSMQPLAAMSAQLMASMLAEPGRKLKVLDVAAGHGMFGISIARLNPEAEIVAVDWGDVLDVAADNAILAGVQNQYQTLAGSIFHLDIGSGYDLVLLPNFLHHFDMSTNIDLLKKLRMAMKPDGMVATLEFVPNEDRVSPPIAAGFSLVMLANTNSGDAYTFRELDDMFRSAGFGESRLQDLLPTPQRLVLTNVTAAPVLARAS